MLILTRHTGEIIHVGDEVTVIVLGVKGNQVRIGVTAPKDMPVHREEIWLRIQNGAPDVKREAAPEADGTPTILVKPRRKPPPA